ncbi:amino acid adenylation domain-containing protein [Thermoactinomyces sp. DSM 45891]|uniref:hybrid non-ribosomal peptide synthetase/type I polyketide synthase n=1 Tax=Thermoactinomyces sp. DSM 45891 TaxID=1761907 RepID=UPI0009249325|nr:non-ribosomal peptide synthetase [Thermoactinomyces sp. DSM 45891]SFX17664.1 amino acid adenylation domain-containing protein [Thermoactinomyces sp. DSM 45891]
MAQSVQPNQIEDILTLTPTQEGILYHCLKGSVQQMYVGQVALEVAGHLHVLNLEKALQHVVQENECLRSVFRWEKLSHPVQVILRQMSHHIVEHDLTSLSEQEQKERIVQMDEEERSKGFDLTKGPLLRISASKVSAEQYRVLINFHHIMMDGWSLGVFLSEWFGRYGQLQSNQMKKSQPKTKYKEYVKWLKQQETGKAKLFWNRVLQSWEPTTKLPYKPDRNETHLHMNSVVTSLSDIMPEVSHFSKTYGVTPNTILNVAWGVMLQRYSGSDDVTFGLTVSGRPDEMQGVDQTVGLFINTVPVRVTTESQQTVAELMSEVHKQSVEMKEYEYLPLTDIHSAAKLRGNESLFDHILVFENYPLDQKLLEGAYHDFQITQYSEWELNNYDLTVAFLLAGEPQMKFDYMDGLFDRQTMERMAEHFQVVLRQIMSRPDELVQNLDILPEWEKQLTLFQFNQTEQAFPKDKTVYQLFVEQVKASPSMNAVVFQDESITYEQLFERVQRLVGKLQSYGVVPGNVVSIQLDWSIDMVVAIMGVLGTGAAYVPIDPHYPSERIEYILQDSRSQLLITSTEFKDSSSEMMSHVLVLDHEESDVPHHEESEFMQVVSSPNDLAYVIYTSGSTGRPKGVMIEQESFVEFVTWAVKEYEHRLGYQVLLTNSFAFDSSIQQIFPPLVSGGTLHLLHPDVRKDARQYLDYLKQHRINNIDEIPVIMNVLIEQVDESDELPLLPDLTCLSLGSEYVPIELVKNCRTYLNRDGRIINGYGPAEASVETCTYHFDGNSEHEISLVGKPRDNTRVYILDQQGRLCPIGVSGEICVSGVGLARGYLYQPDLTNEKFIANSFSGIPGDRLYKTGDAGRWLADGNVEYVGRIDNQVKIRGFRVELGEIENVLLKHPDVNDAVVIARKNGSGDTEICAFLKAESKLTKHDVNVFLADKLPNYMIPMYYEYVESYPLTPNGKVDRKALAQLAMVPAVEEQDVSSSRHELDEQIIAVWKEVLGLENVGIYTNFFEAGGNSIQIMRAFNKLKKVLPDLSLEISDLFTYNTIASLADFVNQSNEVSKEESAFTVEDREELAESIEATTTRDIAIIGISAKLPGADDVDEWWELLREGKSSIQEIPESRIKLDPGQNPAKQYLRYGYIEGIDQFDPQYFNISPKLAKDMDPNQRMMLETVNSTIEDAGYPREKLANQNVGVFMGSVMPSYMNHVDIKVDELLASNLPANLAGRVSYHFGLNGPSMVIDTACSSSLVALHSAMNALRYRECEMALVGGVHIEIDHIRKEIAMGSGIVSPTETCRAFSDDADGTIGGEGSICIMIKPLEKAVADQDHIYGVIKGSAVVQDGARSNGMTAPSPDAQAETIVRAWQDAKIDPATISYIEAHGTGTKLGDPIEVKGIRKAYESYTDQKQFIAMGSVKTNMGHLDSAAGLAGLVKAVLSFQYGMIPPSLHYTKPNAFIDFENSPVYINTSLQTWEKPEGHPRRAGISSFGLSGTNVHVVVEEYEQPKTASDQAYLVTLSAPTEKVLHEKIRDLERDLAKKREYELADISYTLNCRRNHDSYRFSTVVRDHEELSKALEEMKGMAEKPVKRPKKVVLWIPDYEVGMEKAWDGLSQTGWIDESIMSQHQPLLDHSQDPKAKVVAFASSLYHLLRKLGMEIEIEGAGLGVVARDFILGTISFTDVLQGTNEKNQTMADVVSKFGEETLVLSVGSCIIKDVSAVGYDVEVRDLFTLEKKEHDFLSVLSHLYQMGYNLHFEAIQQGRTVSLPTYPFQRKSYWFEQSKKQKRGSSLFNQDHTESIKVKEEMMYTFEWVVSELPVNLSSRGLQGAVLIITDPDSGTTHASLVEKFTDHGHQVIQIHYGRQYRNVADNQVEINPREEEHFTRVMKELRESGVSIGTVMDLSRFQSTSLSNVSMWDYEQLDEKLATSLQSTLNLVKSLATLGTNHPVYTFFVTQQAYLVGANDHYVNPLHSSTLALSRTMNREFDQVHSFCIDVCVDSSDKMAQMIYEEVSKNNMIREVAYRGGKRYTKTLKRMPIESMTKREMIRESGVYLVTGGTGGIAQEICQSMAKRHNVILILVGRTSEQDLSSQQIESMDTIRRLGSEVHYYQADVASLVEMNSVLDDITARFGKVDGVIHTAGVLGKPVSLQDSKLEDYTTVMEAKVKGTLVLDQLLKEHYVDFFLVFSSVDAVLSEKMIAPYACANAFLDSYTSLQRQIGKRFISIQWGGWQNTGMGEVKRAKENHASVDKIKRLSPLILGFNRNDGVAAFHTVLGSNVSPAFVSGLNQEDMEEIRGLSFFGMDSQLVEAKPEASQPQASWTFEQIVEVVTNTWREVLEFEEDEELGPDESYFSLGGDSIQGIDIMVELSNLFSLKMDADTIFRFDSVQALSQHIFDSLHKPKKAQKIRSIPKARPIQ